jgi:hypothetical protein
MWQMLDVLVRLMCLGAFVFVGWWIWAICSAPETGRDCVGCGGKLSEYDLANCYKCLTSSFKGVK